jgi:hypothetical protein
MSGASTDYITNFILNAKDNFSGAFDKLKNQTKDVHTQFVSLQTLLAGGMAAGFVALIENAIEAGDRLWTMHEKTGIAVETLGGLDLAAKQSNTSLESLQGGARKLMERMIEAREPTSEAAQAFATLGVSAFDTTGKMKPLGEMIIELAGKFGQYSDEGPEKSANANYLFGKSGMDLLPILKIGEEGLRDLVATHIQLGGHTTESAKAADDFGDKMVIVKRASEGVWTQIASALLPTLSQLADMYIKSAKESDKYNDSLSLTTLIVKSITSAVLILIPVFQTVGEAVAAFAANIVDSLTNWGRGTQAINLSVAEQITARWSTLSDRLGKLWEDPVAKVTAGADKTSDGLVMPLLKAKEKAEKLKDDFGPIIQKFSNMYVQALADTESGYEKTTQAEKEWLALQNSPVWQTMTQDQKEQAALVMERAHNQQFLNERIKDFDKLAQESVKYVEDYKKGMEEWKQKINDNAGAFVDEMLKMQDEIKLVGLSGDAHDAAVAKLKLETDYRAGLIPTYDEYIDRLGKITQAYLDLSAANKTKEDAQKNIEMWKQIAEAGEQAFERLFEKGSNVFKDLTAVAKKTLLDILYQITAKQWLISLGTTGGLLSGDAAAQMMGSGSSGTGITGMLGSAVQGSNLYQSAVASMTASGGYAAGSSIGAGAGGYLGFAGSETGTALGLSAATTTAEGVAITELTAVGAAIPVIGWIVAAAALLYAIYSKPGGGPKSGGFAASGTDASQWDRFFTPSDQDAELQKTAAAWQTDYRKLVKGLGGKALDDMTFAIGFDTDPKGDAMNRVSAGVSSGGRSVWSMLNKDIGNDPKNIGVELGIAYSTALAQAIKASDITGIVGRVWQEVGTVTQEQLNRMIKFSEALIVIQNSVNADVLGDAAKVEAQAHMTAIDNYKASAVALQEMSRQYDGSEQATYDLAAATSQFHAMAIQLVVAIDNISEAFSKTIETSKRQIELTGLEDEAKRTYLQSEIDRLMEQLGTTTDPAKIKEIGERINTDILDIFGTLGSADQLAQKSHYLEWLDAIETQVNTRLDALKQVVLGEGEFSYTTVMQTVGEQLAAAGDRITAAARDMQTAADTMNTAASNFRAGSNINITVNTTTGEVGVSPA